MIDIRLFSRLIKMDGYESCESLASLVSMVNSMYDEGNSSSEFDETDFVRETEQYFESEIESNADSETETNNSRPQTFTQSFNENSQKKIFQGSFLNARQF